MQLKIFQYCKLAVRNGLLPFRLNPFGPIPIWSNAHLVQYPFGPMSIGPMPFGPNDIWLTKFRSWCKIVFYTMGDECWNQINVISYWDIMILGSFTSKSIIRMHELWLWSAYFNLFKVLGIAKFELAHQTSLTCSGGNAIFFFFWGGDQGRPFSGGENPQKVINFGHFVQENACFF